MTQMMRSKNAPSLARPRILFIHNGRTTFVALDVDCMREIGEVTELHLRSRIPLPSLWRQVASHDVVVGWFASWHMVAPLLYARLLNKPSMLFIVGYDIANMPEIGYGHQRGGIKKHVSRWCMGTAACLVTSSEYSRGEALRNARVAPERVNVVYQGIPDPFDGKLGDKYDPVILTVGNVDRGNLLRKGHEPFVRAAALVPTARFVLVGNWADDAIGRLKAIATPNVEFTGRVDSAGLVARYRAARVYVQASAHEGFGMSVAEAMLGGCIPVVTRAGSLPEVVGDTGIYAESQAPEHVAAAIRSALEEPRDHGILARNRVLAEFPMGKRQAALGQLLTNLVRK